ncbi:MAG: hypothetical protein J5J00_03855, partial [Deltaproteobacteria bacterium]|nr:hypothetical protein [Deltaproteobacteria bacterium]
KNSQLIFQTGGGIVFDSDAEIEYRESMFKAAGLYRAWKAASRDCGSASGAIAGGDKPVGPIYN